MARSCFLFYRSTALASGTDTQRGAMSSESARETVLRLLLLRLNRR